METVPCIRLTHLTEQDVRAYRLADNQLATLAGIDKAALAVEFQYLQSQLDFDIGILAFETAYIDLTIQNASAPLDEDEQVEIDLSLPAVTQLGDQWVLGDHIVRCGDALLDENYHQLMGEDQAQIVVTDMPYNVCIAGNVSGKGKVKHNEFAMASGEMSQAAFISFMRTSMGHMARYSADGSIHYQFIDWRHIGDMLTAADGVYAELKNICVWNKTNAGMGSLYRSKHEFIAVFKNGTAPHINNIELGKHGRNRTNVWNYPGQTTMHAKRDKELAMHPTVKNANLIADAMLDCSHRDGIVLDPFGGSGSTLVAAQKTGRRARLMELEPKFVDVTIRRWQKLTGQQARHAISGALFDDVQPAHAEVSHG